MRLVYCHGNEKDEYIQWKSDSFNKETDSVAWSDRLWEQDDEKYDDACRKVWGNTGQMFYDRKPEDIEKFLSLYFDRKVTLTAVAREQNRSTGYAYWIFYFRKEV